MYKLDPTSLRAMCGQWREVSLKTPEDLMLPPHYYMGRSKLTCLAPTEEHPRFTPLVGTRPCLTQCFTIITSFHPRFKILVLICVLPLTYLFTSVFTCFQTSYLSLATWQSQHFTMNIPGLCSVTDGTWDPQWYVSSFSFFRYFQNCCHLRIGHLNHWNLCT